MNTYQLELGTAELEALQKTVSIALDNLNNKIGKHGTNSPVGKAAVVDRMLLLSTQAEIIAVLSEAYDV